MRKSKREAAMNDFSILTLDDDPIITSTIQAYFQRSGYQVDVEQEPYRAIERVREGNYDILLLDFLMNPICGDKVVEEIRKFNRDIFIILLTGHKSVAPPIKTIRELDIQGYHEKSDRFDQLEMLVESCVKSIRQMRTIRHYQEGLAAMIESLPEIYHIQELEPIADSILQTGAKLLGTDVGALQVDPAFCGGEEADPPLPFVTRVIGAPMSYPGLKDVRSDPDCFAQSRVCQRDGWVLAGVRGDSGELLGVLSLRCESAPDRDRMQLLEVFTRQVAVAMRNVSLHSVLHRKNAELVKAYGTLRDSYMEMAEALRLLVDARDIYTRGHSDRVSEMAAKIAQALGRDEEYCQMVRLAGLFHDIGKVGVPDQVLMKASPLTEEEFAQIRKHPLDGARILSAIRMYREIVPVVRAHHERMDGKGYPDGLAGEEIPEAARIIAVADAYDAMTSDRSYRKALPVEQAVAQMEKGRGTQFDSAVVDALLKVVLG